METSKRNKESEGRVDNDVIRRRKLHIVYFLSRNGNTEQPHLITVVVDHLFTINNAVHLRDVKKWMADIRGKEMTDSFAWSYKRKYKSGYIWEDLTDDDVITPISNHHEYVIKGSLLLPPTNPTDFFIEEQQQQQQTNIKSMASTSTSKPAAQETLSENAFPKPCSAGGNAGTSFAEREERRTAVFRLDSWRAEKERCTEIVSKSNGDNGNEMIDNGSRRWASDVLKNLLKCKTAETKDSVTRAMSNRGGESGIGGGESDAKSNAVRKKCETSGSKAGKTTSTMYKPASEPSCSQCGRPFRPEKMNVHMNSCKGLKERGRR